MVLGVFLAGEKFKSVLVLVVIVLALRVGVRRELVVNRGLSLFGEQNGEERDEQGQADYCVRDASSYQTLVVRDVPVFPDYVAWFTCFRDLWLDGAEVAEDRSRVWALV